MVARTDLQTVQICKEVSLAVVPFALQVNLLHIGQLNWAMLLEMPSASPNPQVPNSLSSLHVEAVPQIKDFESMLQAKKGTVHSIYFPLATSYTSMKDRHVT